eukprot:gene927-7751_t
MPDVSVGTVGGDRANQNRKERQYTERLELEKLYIGMAPELKAKGMSMREILALKSNAMHSLENKHREEDKEAVDKCYAWRASSHLADGGHLSTMNLQSDKPLAMSIGAKKYRRSNNMSPMINNKM